MKSSTLIWATLISFALTACGTNVKTKLIGTWKLDANTASKFDKTASDSEETNDTDSDKKTPAIIGKWKLVKIEGEELSNKEKETSMEFRKDGTFKQFSGKAIRTGEWEVSKDKKFIKITPKTGKIEKMNIVKYKNNRLTFTDGIRDKEITLEKMGGKDNDNEEDNTRKKKTQQEGVLEFRKDASYIISIDKNTQNGKWEVAKDNKSLTLSPDKGVSQTLDIVKIDENEFTFRGKGASSDISLRKK